MKITNRYKSVQNIIFGVLEFWLLSVVIVGSVIICGVLINYFILPPSKPFEYEVIGFSACKGWDDSGNPKKQTVFFSDEKNIFACGELHSNYPVTLSVDWFYEGKPIQRDVIMDVKDRFLSELTLTNESLQEGNYEVRLIIGNPIVQRAAFEVISSK